MRFSLSNTVVVAPAVKRFFFYTRILLYASKNFPPWFFDRLTNPMGPPVDVDTFNGPLIVVDLITKFCWIIVAAVDFLITNIVQPFSFYC